MEVGPIVNESQFDEVLAAIERGRDEGGTVIAGGERADDDGIDRADGLRGRRRRRIPLLRRGLRAGHDALPLQGPRRRDGARERRAVRSPTAIFTSSLATAARFQREAQAGLIHVNSQTAGADVHVPFGGIKSSGFGPHEQGRAAIEFYTDLVTVYVDP